MSTRAPPRPEERPSPVDLRHHFSEITKRRGPSFLTTSSDVYSIPGMKNISGGVSSHTIIPRTVDEKHPTKRIDITTPLQYWNPNGNPALLSWVRRFTLETLHPSIPYRDGPSVVMTSGATDALSKVI
ncbi:hypothetical protein QBC39DRAFT_332281 [Podospora conica]|nr:hypothetical protein QBC39DRAFT_332281 [Schizothecium conicum]